MNKVKENTWGFFRRATKVQRKAILQALTYIMAAFGLVAALAWNEAIKELINQYFEEGSNIISKFIYAIVVTFIAVLVTLSISKFQDKEKK
ncbi:DUF5654 family protein [Patescibacteria group bacterium]